MNRGQSKARPKLRAVALKRFSCRADKILENVSNQNNKKNDVSVKILNET